MNIPERPFLTQALTDVGNWVSWPPTAGATHRLKEEIIQGCETVNITAL